MIQGGLFWIVLAVAVPLFWRSKAEHRPLVLAGASAGLLATQAPWVVLGLVAFTLTTVPLFTRGRWAYGVFFLALLGALATAKAFAAAEGVLVPLGMSFFTFRLLHYGIERARGTLPPHRLVDVLAWILFFPVFTAGPIARFDTWRDRAEPTWTRDGAVEGLTRIAHGLVKRFVFAEAVESTMLKGQSAADMVEHLGWLTTVEVWTFVIASFLRLWFDFSGYTDIALGAARLFGLRLEENFRWPILARSPADFWRRWHTSLSGWCQAYIYLPLIGITRSPTAAALVTFLVMGLWHAASAPWLLWGVYHGLGVALTAGLARAFRRRRPHPALAILTVPLTFLFVTSAHAFTAASTGWDAIRVWAVLFGVRL